MAGVAGVLQLRSAFLWWVTHVLMTVSYFGLEIEEWVEIKNQIYSL